MSRSACPSEETLARFAGGDDVDVRAHLASCGECRATVADLVRSHRPVATTRDATPSSDERLLTRVEPGVVIGGKYRIEALAGEGGMGKVYRAEHLGLGTQVAVKVLRAELAVDERARRRFLREARAAAVLTGANAVRIYDVDELTIGLPYIVMEHLDGENLASTMEARGPLDARVAARWMAQACTALAEAHALGIIHRDVKPANLVVVRSGTDDVVKVVDFGLVLALSDTSGLSRSMPAGVMAGSPLYMSPEQVRGDDDVDERTDVWAVGATLHHLVAGTPPFVGPTLPIVCARILSQDAAPLERLRPGTPRALAEIVTRCLRRERDARFATMQELRTALLSASVVPEVEAREEPSAPRPPPISETARTIRDDGATATSTAKIAADDATSTTETITQPITQPTPTKPER